MIVGFSKLLTLSGDETIDLTDTLVDGHDPLDRLEGIRRYNRQLRDTDTLMQATLTEAKGCMQKNRGGMTGIPTGLAELDKMTGGWQNSDLITTVARPVMGKTAFALHLAEVVAVAGHYTVVHNLEMQARWLGGRWLLPTEEMDSYLWRSGKLSQETRLQARQTAGKLARLPICVDDNPDISTDRVRSNARLLQSKGKCDPIIIDYLQLCDMRIEQTNRNREQEVTQASRETKLLVKELYISVVLLNQLNRGSENRAYGRLELTDLHESGVTEQDSDLVSLLYRPALAHPATDKQSGYPTEGLGVVIITKYRNGGTGNVYFGHNKSMTKIGSYIPPMEWIKKNARQRLRFLSLHIVISIISLDFVCLTSYLYVVIETRGLLT